MQHSMGKATEILNKLLRINNDRVVYYRKASKNAKESNLKAIFDNVANESEKNASAIVREITQSGKTLIESNRTSESFLYRFSMTLRAIIAGKNRKSMVDSCVPGEEATQAAYFTAISSDELTMQSRQMVRNQQASIKALYDILITFRNTPNASIRKH